MIGVLRDAEQPEAVDHERHRELAGDHDGGQPARAERLDGFQRDEHVDGAEQAADERPPGHLADVAERAEAAAQDEADRDQRGRADEEREGRRLHAADGLAEARVDRRLHRHEAARRRAPRNDREPARHFASSQFCPTPMSTASGGSCGSHTPTISRSISSRAASASSGGPSNSSSSWIVRSSFVARPDAASAAWHAHHRELDDVGGGALDRRC